MYAECTKRTYQTSINLFDKYSNKRHTLIQFRNYIDSLKNQSPSTIKTRFYAIQNYFISNNISNIEDIKRVVRPYVKSRNKSQKKLVKYLTSEQLEIYKTYVNNNIKKSNRLKTLLLLLPYTGLRIGEITKLRKNNIFINNNNYFLVFIGKGNKERKVPLNQEAKDLLLSYINKNNFKESDLLFPISTDAVRDSIRNFKDKIHFSFLTPHILRHTFATLLLQKGIDITTISQLMGHSSPVITLNIYSHTNDAKMLEAVNAF